jgi:hypothetical protein
MAQRLIPGAGFVDDEGVTGQRLVPGVGFVDFGEAGTGGGTLDAAASGTATASGTANASYDGPTIADAAASGAAVASGTANAELQMPTVTSEQLYDNVPNLLANEPLTYVAVYHPDTGALVVRKTGLSTDATGRYTFTDPALSLGVNYLHDWLTVSGHRRMPVKAAA